MTARSLLVLLALALVAAPLALGQDAVKKHQESKDPAALKPGAVQTMTTQSAAPTKPAAPPPPTGSEVGQAVDAMASSCSKALTLHTEISALAAKVKASRATRQTSSQEMRKKLRSLKATHGKVKRASKKPGTDAAALVETARTDYENALAESKTFEVETQAIQSSEDQLIRLVAAAQEASDACTKYEATVRTAALLAKKAVADARRNAAKARAMAAIKQEKARAADRDRQAKDLVAVKAETEAARTELETMKGEAAAQPAPAAPTAGPAEKKPAPAATPVKDPNAPNQGKKGEAPGQLKKP